MYLLRTNQHVHFYLWEGKKQNHYNLDVGKYYYVDVSKPHVQNKAIFDRLHLVVDCYNNPRLENLLKQGDELEDDICSPSDFEKVKSIFYSHKKWFTHVRTDYMKRMIS